MREQFPLIADDEVLVREQRLMDLYDDMDLISNIHGPYEDRHYHSEEAISRWALTPSPEKPSSSVVASQTQGRQASYRSAARNSSAEPVSQIAKSTGNQEVFSYTQVAREQAREDLRRKRSAPYLNFDKPGFKSKELPKPRPTQRDLDKEQMDDLTRAANRLRQEHYIIAEIKPDLPPVDLPKEETKPKKNTYDFLKTSRVYNYAENRKQKEKKIAQELNLTRFDKWKN